MDLLIRRTRGNSMEKAKTLNVNTNKQKPMRAKHVEEEDPFRRRDSVSRSPPPSASRTYRGMETSRPIIQGEQGANCMETLDELKDRSSQKQEEEKAKHTIGIEALMEIKNERIQIKN